jgi:hypothetical protein
MGTSFSKTITIDVDTGRVMSGTGRANEITLQQALGRLSGNNINVGLQFVRPRGAENFYEPLERQDKLSMVLRVYRPNQFATSGNYTVQFGSDTTEEISLTSSLWEQQCTINALASITAAGGVDIVIPNCNGDFEPVKPECVPRSCYTKFPGAFQIVFRDVGARDCITLTPIGILPKCDITLHCLSTGDATTREANLFEFREAFLSSIDARSWTRDAAPKIKSIPLVTGDTITRAKQRVSIEPSPAGGHFSLDVGGATTGYFSAAATAADLEIDPVLECVAKVRKVDDFAWDLEFVAVGAQQLIRIGSDQLTPAFVWRAEMCWDCDMIKMLLANCPGDTGIDAVLELKAFDLGSQTVLPVVKHPIKITRTFA